MGSGGGGGSGNPALLLQGGTPMPGLPVAGKDSNIGDPYNYGKFQNFLPDIPAEGRAPSATGLRPDMFKYRSPDGIIDPGSNSGDSSGSGGDVAGQIKSLRDDLAKLTAGGQGGVLNNTGDPGANMIMPGTPQTMGMGAGGGGGMAGAHPEYAQPGVAGFTAFAPWASGGPGVSGSVRAGAQQGPTDWQAKDAAAAAAAAEAAKKATAGT